MYHHSNTDPLILIFIAPVEAPQNIEATAVDSNAIDLSWDPPPPDSQNGDIEHYLINATAAESEEIVQLMSTMDSIRISNLEPFYTYSFVISAITTGPGPYSSPVTVTTFEDGRDILFIYVAYIWF